ncbi:DNA primase/polymerase [Cyanophage S-2L]|nr:DNA primase/polymerase [Cyanophage S-2L]
MSTPAPAFDRDQILLHLSLLRKDIATTRYRAIWPRREDKVKAWTTPLTGATVQDAVTQGFNSYIVVGDGGDSDAEITSVNAIFGEWDDGDLAWQVGAWEACGLPRPSFQLRTGGKSIHHYWVFHSPVDVPAWTELQARLIALAGFDTTNRNPSRVMRLAGCPHQRTGEVAQIFNATGELYDPGQMLQVLPPVPIDPPAAAPVAPGGAPSSMDDIRAALAQIPPRPGAGSGTYAEYRNILWGLVKAVEEAGGTRDQAVAMMQAHSPEGWDCAQVARSGGKKISTGTFWWHAMSYGWAPPKKAPEPPPQARQVPAVAAVLQAAEAAPGTGTEHGPWAPLPPGWQGTNKEGLPRASQITTYELALLMQVSLRGVLWHNEMSGEVMHGKTALSPIELQIAYSRLEGLGYKVTKENAKTAILQASIADLRHPVREYLNTCTTPLPDEVWADIANALLGPGHSAFDSSAIRKWLIFAVARVFQPGCPFGFMLVLAGAQQMHKTRFFNTLASDEWFLGGFQRGRSDTDDLIALHRSWITEWGELDGGLSKHDSAELKAMIDRKVDVLRRPYAATHESCPRSFVLCGTTNRRDGLFTDPTGNRRYVVVPVNQRIDSERLEQMRDQIWATALREYRSGKLWYLDEEELEINAKRNKGLEVEDAWVGTIQMHLNSSIDLERLTDGRYGINIESVYLKIEPEVGRRGPGFGKRIRDTMLSLGWEPVRLRLASDPSGNPVRRWAPVQGG